MSSLETLFGAVNQTNTQGTQEYTIKEKVIALFDVNDRYFAIITDRIEMSRELGVEDENFRYYSCYFGYRYFKKNPVPAEIIPHGLYRGCWPELYSRTRLDLIENIKKIEHAQNLKEVKSIKLDIGTVSIFCDDLILNRK